MSQAEEFEELRPLLSAIAGRILGSGHEAEHAVQKSWLRWESCPTWPMSARAFLSAEVTQISLDILCASGAQQEEHTRPWCPEQLPDDSCQGAEQPAESVDPSLMATLVQFERLSPLERAVFVLREVFGCGFPQIASAVGCSEAACRQLVATDRMVGDGKGQLSWPKRVVGAENVARALTTMLQPLLRIGITMDKHVANGQPRIILRDRNGRIISAWELEIVAGRVRTISWAVGPDKPGHLDPVADA